MHRRVLRSLFRFQAKVLGGILLVCSWSFPCVVHGQEPTPTSQEMSARIDELLEDRQKELGWNPITLMG